MTADQIIGSINATVVRLFDLNRNDVKPDVTLASLGLSRLDRMELAYHIETGFNLNQTLAESEWSTLADVHASTLEALGIGEAA
jgi:hypothetical protein